ncbi:MAG: RNA polymerase sigma factor SigJ [Solirubrobacteraceae bacterium]|nr:RNA polymerase sigma factor SigJ [Solirubrobacteraceae bacterium]
MSDVAERFEELRPRLLRIAYSQLGSLAEAEDVVQDAWLRLERADLEAIEDLTGWLVTVVGRLALDALGSARVRRERYVGPWLPDPLVGAAAGDDADPADRVTLDETVSHALLFVLERLSPAERTAFILHDVFGYSFQEVGDVVGRTPAAARQLASRARRHVVEQRPRQSGTHEQQQRVVAAFAAAAGGGDLDALLAVLDPDVVMRSDGGGRVRAARKPLIGADRVSRALVALARKFAARSDVRFTDVNGLPGLIMVSRDDGELSVLAFTVDADRITTIHMQRNPDKLSHVAVPGE